MVAIPCPPTLKNITPTTPGTASWSSFGRPIAVSTAVRWTGYWTSAMSWFSANWPIWIRILRTIGLRTWPGFVAAVTWTMIARSIIQKSHTPGNTASWSGRWSLTFNWMFSQNILNHKLLWIGWFETIDNFCYLSGMDSKNETPAWLDLPWINKNEICQMLTGSKGNNKRAYFSLQRSGQRPWRPEELKRLEEIHQKLKEELR